VELNPYQERAVVANGHCTVLACPGSGKTRVLAARAAHLLGTNERGRLCAVTFTRDAAYELKSRILSACGKTDAVRLAVGTFHSIALSQMRRNQSSGLGRLISDGERLSLIRRCWQQHAKRLPLESIVQAIDAAKSRLEWQPSECAEIEAALQSYGETLQAEGSIDFADLMLQAVRDIQSKAMPPLSIRWLLVDEAQDMDAVQMEWVKAHADHGIEITLVGDDDQSLYSFRHAMGYEGLRHISEYLSSTVMSLPINYRCPENILQHANRLIAHNADRAPKNVEAFRKSPGVVDVIRLSDRWSEADLIASRIQAEDANVKWAILGRTNSILDWVEVAFADRDASYYRKGGKSVWDKSVGSTLLGLLRSVADGSWTGVANALFFCGMAPRLVNELSRIQGNTCHERLNQIVAEHQPSMSSGNDAMLLMSLRDGLHDWAAQDQRDRSALVIHAVTAWLADRTTEENGSLLRRLEGILCRLNGGLSARLMKASYRTKAGSEGTAIMTLHAVKGLEFPNVWILGTEEGNLPHSDSTPDEERRLFYVGMTRSKNRLIVSSAAKEGSASRFIAEAGMNSSIAMPLADRTSLDQLLF
jgi:superfamily I DNA/RNA helicase